MDAIAAELQKVLDEGVASGEECGCQLAVFRHGKLLYNLVSGYTTPEKTQAVTPETLFTIFSVGKGIMTTLMHRLAEQGKLDYDDKVTDYWPEYGAAGKGATTIREVMSHRAGLWLQPKSLTMEEMFDWPKVTAALAAEPPHDVIGGMHHYHAHTYGILTGRIAELADGRPLRRMLQEEILDPLHIDSFFYGLPEADYARLAQIVGPAADGRMAFNQKVVLSGLNPSSNGCSNAYSLAKIYAALGPSGVDGVRLLTDSTIEKATQLCRWSGDTDLSNWDKFGLGYALCGPAGDIGRMFGHGGALGAEGFYDKATGYAVGFTKNRINSTHPVHPTRDAVSRVLGLPIRVW